MLFMDDHNDAVWTVISDIMWPKKPKKGGTAGKYVYREPKSK